MMAKSIETLCDRRILGHLEEAEDYGKEKLVLAREKRPFCIVVCGMFSTGKSSLINALLGTDLPTGIFPVTKVVTKIRYGEKTRIILKHMTQNQEMEVSRQAAEEIITDQTGDGQYSNYQIIIEYPSDMLKNDIIIIDTPGMNDDAQRRLDEVTRTEIRNADFCIINFLCTKFAEQDERVFLNEMQELTNGNFISVLNCINLLQGGEQQLADLEERARFVLSEYGNQRVGQGKYFRVDSQNKNDAYLDGLDEWLERMIEDNRQALQADTPLTMAYTELKKIKAECDQRIRELYEETEKLRDKNKAIIGRQKRQTSLDRNLLSSQIDSRCISEKDRLHMLLTGGLRERLNAFTKDNINNYADSAKSHISDIALDFATSLRKRTVGSNGIYGNISVSYSIRQEFNKCLSGFQVPAPEYKVYERGLFDIDRYMVGKTYRVYNDYVGATINEVERILLPRLKLRIDEFFASVKSSVETTNTPILKGGYEDDIERMEQYANQLSERSLNVLMVLRDVRNLRDALV